MEITLKDWKAEHAATIVARDTSEKMFLINKKMAELMEPIIKELEEKENVKPSKNKRAD